MANLRLQYFARVMRSIAKQRGLEIPYSNQRQSAFVWLNRIFGFLMPRLVQILGHPPGQ